MMNFKKTVLENGMRVVLAPQEDNPAVTVLVLVETGSKYESKEINGISHFLEHMVFKGTKNRPKSIDISLELDSIGARYNAFTSFEVTGYWIKVEKSHLDTVLDVISDISLNPVFDPDEIEKEKNPIIEEINLDQDTPTRQIGRNLIDLLYGDQPAGWHIAGTKELVKSITRDDLVKYKEKNYVAEATTVVVAGSIDTDHTLEKIKTKFKDIQKGPKNTKLPVKESQESPQLAIKEKDLEQTHMLFGFRGYSLSDEKRYAAEVLADILGSGFSSRLFIKVREEMAAAYHVYAYSSNLTDHGYFGIYAGVDTSRREEVVRAILEECQNLKDQKIPEKELQKSKNHLIGGMMLGLETSDDLADFYGEQEILTGEILQPEEIIKKIKAVTAEEIQAVANEVFINQKLNLAVIGPKGDELALKEALDLS